MTLADKYKTKDQKLKDRLAKAYDKFKRGIRVHEAAQVNPWDAYKSDILDELSTVIQDQIDDWKSFWDSPDDMERDLDTASDWFWDQFLDESIAEDIIDSMGIDEDDLTNDMTAATLLDYIENVIPEEVGNLIDTLCEETSDYMYDCREWDDDNDDRW